MNRRQFLNRSLGWSAGVAAGGALAGCAAPPDPRTVVFRGWAYEPDLVQANVDAFTRKTQIPVDYAAVSGNYHDKMVALFIAHTPVDCCYVRDDHFAEWVDAGWLQPIDAFPEALEYQDDLFDFNREAMIHNGRLYGLPYYVDFTIWVYNQRMYEQAGLEKPGRTLDEVAEECIRLKEAKVQGPDGIRVEYPLAMGFKQAPLGFNDWWALNYASEVDLFDDELNPRFPDDEGNRAERILQWLVDGIHKHHIIDKNASFNLAVIRDNMAAGRQAMISLSKYDLQRLNNPARSAIAGEAKMALYPALEPGLNGTLGWTRMYCLTKGCRDVERAWKLVQYMGGKDEHGEYTSAKGWYLKQGLGFAYKSLLEEAEVVDSTSKWGDIQLIREQGSVAKAREIVKAPWFAEFDTYFQAEIQGVLLKEQSPRDGLGRIAAEARRLKKEWDV